MRLLVLTAALLALTPGTIRADVGPPAHMQITERDDGLYTVQWRVPTVLPPRAVPVPQLPEGCAASGEVSIVEQRGAWLFTQDCRCETGLAGQVIGMRYPFPDLALTTVVRVDLLSGDRFAHVLTQGETSWQLPEGTSAPDPVGDARRVVLLGVKHAASSWVHIVFLGVLALIGSLPIAIRLVTAFTGAQVVAVLVLAAAHVRPESFPLEAGFALSVALLSREALRPPTARRGLVPLAAVAGLLHGAGIGGLIADGLGDAQAGLGFGLLAVLGVDALHVAGAVVIGSLWRWLVRGRPAIAVARATAYGTGVIGIALAIGLALRVGAPVDDAVATDTLPARSQANATTSVGPAGSRRVAPSVPNAPIQSFVTVEPFEVRHEVMLRLVGLTDVLGLGASSVIEVGEQAALAEDLAALVLDGTHVRVDGAVVPAQLRRVDFMSVDPTGALPRANPMPEPVGEAVAGVIVVYAVDGMAETVELTWRSFPASIAGLPATVVDPESVSQHELSPAQPTLAWENALSEDPIPTVSAVPVEPVRVSVPWLSLPCFALALALGLAGFRRRRPVVAAAARVALAVAFVAGPLIETAVALPRSAGRTPAEPQARRIAAGLLPNVYRALEFREESAVYDRLSLSLTGETLSQVYLELRRGLELEERGGAQARVEAVEVLEASEVESRENGFLVRAVWNVGGMVTHFGHRHFRQNRYDARLGIVAVEGAWKIRSLEILELERLR